MNCLLWLEVVSGSAAMENNTLEDMMSIPNITSDEDTITELAKSYTMYKIGNVTTSEGILLF